MDRRTLAWGLALFGLFGLMAALTLWHAWIAPPRELPRALLLIVTVGPLFLPMRGLLHGRPRTAAWATFLALFYFIAGIDHIATPGARAFGWVETLLALCLFLGSMFYARLEGRRRRRIIEQARSNQADD
ncbi:MAG: DUF2069 domain-containing protein [Gammaproteobacteria bacterium]|nr:MAG: DUF2069 domain-containing protein [Gammaproteobacteria bacterium]